MREVIEGAAGTRPGRSPAGGSRSSLALPGGGRLLTVAALTLAHQLDHVLRADASGWPFTRDLTWFTDSLLVYPALIAGVLLLRERP